MTSATYQPTSAHSVGLAHVRVVKAWLADQDSQRMRRTEASVEGGWLLPARPNSQDQSAWPSTRREQQHRTSTPGRPCPALAGSGASGARARTWSSTRALPLQGARQPSWYSTTGVPAHRGTGPPARWSPCSRARACTWSGARALPLGGARQPSRYARNVGTGPLWHRPAGPLV